MPSPATLHNSIPEDVGRGLGDVPDPAHQLDVGPGPEHLLLAAHDLSPGLCGAVQYCAVYCSPLTVDSEVCADTGRRVLGGLDSTVQCRTNSSSAST